MFLKKPPIRELKPHTGQPILGEKEPNKKEERDKKKKNLRGYPLIM
jgi:hypothetical protein